VVLNKFDIRGSLRRKHCEPRDCRIIMDTPHIISDPRIMHGKPVIEGTWLTVELILEKLSEGRSEEELLSAYPRLTKEGLQAALVSNSI
jgi:uncharacterized protein (DUF433 family)